MRNSYLFTLLAIVAVGIVACKKTSPDEVELAQYDGTAYNFTYSSTLPAPDLPSDNLLTESKVYLGRKLFYDTKLSGDGSMSCATCHMQGFGFSDTARLSLGIEGLRGKRQAMAIFNLAWHSNQFFWDGRANLLRDQALKPIEDPLEMNETLENVRKKLQHSQVYRALFTRAFQDGEINNTNISLALEAFMLSIVSGNSKYDQFLRGEVNLTDSEERGRTLFFAEYNPAFPDLTGADCAHCHSGSNFENDQYMNNGLDEDADFEDFGRELVTNNAADRAKFKVTSLRNISVTGPYMHDGRFTSLEEVIQHYNTGIKTSSTLDPALANTQSTGLMLDNQDVQDLVAFLLTLRDEQFLNNPDYKNPN